MQKLSEEKEQQLVSARHQIGLYSIRELCAMFGCHRYSIDNALNSGKLKYISPNNRERYIYINVFLKYLEDKSNQVKEDKHETMGS